MKPAVTLLFLLIIGHSSVAQFKFYRQGIDAYEAKDFPGAITNLNEYLDYSLRDKSFDVEVHYYLALSYFKTQSYTSAVREFDHALQLGHKNAGNIHWFMAQSYSALKVPKQAVEEYTQALQIIPENSNRSKLRTERAEQYDLLGDAKSAEADLNEALRLDGSNDKAKGLLARITAKHETSNPMDRNVIVTSRSDVNPDQQSHKTNQESKVLSKNEPAPNPTIIASQPVVEQKKPDPTLADLYQGEKRYALVIGNSAYQFVAPLKNSANDANDMAEELARSNFEVIKVIDGDYNRMREAYRTFQEKLSAGPKDQTVGLFYYAGHGLQNEGENYLVPVEANIKYEDDIPRMCFPLQRVVLANMERSNSRMNIIILDACRNNPFPSAFRSTTAGLAEVRRAKGSFIAYATAPGNVASDGDGRNGLYTQELLKAMRKPGRTLEQVFKDVRLNVMTLSGDRQDTWDQSNIIGDFYFKF